MEANTPNENDDYRDQSFRDSVGTIDKDGDRVWIYPQKPKGWYYNARTYATAVYLTVLFGLPFVKFDGHPLFLFDILNGKFILFGIVFWPQDFYLFGLGMLIFVVFIVLFTVVFGRVFCGWACPQTVFLEMVFRKIEYWIEGDAVHQKKLNHAPWNREKIIKKVSKNLIFFALSFVIANTCLSYLIGIDELYKIITEPISMHVGGLTSILVFTAAFYGVFIRFREQACIVVCPYGRLQGVLLDKDSIVVAYDYKRGEPRKHFNKKEVRTEGDCIDCHQCVKVCPTGIDIRNGTQLECVNCTACIDACDHMMDSVGMEKGLIRYASENNISKGTKLRLTPRIRAYSIVLLILVGVEATLLITRSDIDTTLIRARGMLYQDLPNNKISNLYNIKMVNKTYDNLPVRLVLENPKGEIQMIGKDLFVPKESIASGEFFVILDKNVVVDRKTKLKIGVFSEGKKVKTVQTTFLGPIAPKKKKI